MVGSIHITSGPNLEQLARAYFAVDGPEEIVPFGTQGGPFFARIWDIKKVLEPKGSAWFLSGLGRFGESADQQSFTAYYSLDMKDCWLQFQS